jgi:hypothetical protein
VPELPRDEDDVEALGDQERGGRMPQVAPAELFRDEAEALERRLLGEPGGGTRFIRWRARSLSPLGDAGAREVGIERELGFEKLAHS